MWTQGRIVAALITKLGSTNKGNFEAMKFKLINFINEYNFFEIYSQSNMYCGFPTYISGNGSWMFSSKNGFQGMF